MRDGQRDDRRVRSGKGTDGWGSTGFAIWGYNHGSNDFGSGGQDARLAWATAYQTIPRPAYIGLREAWDDRRVIET